MPRHITALTPRDEPTSENDAFGAQPFPPGGPVIELQQVEKTYSTGSVKVQALQGVSMRIDRGEYVAIMGPSGSGKSTLMHILGCLDVPTSGRFLLAGEDVGEMDEVDLALLRNRRHTAHRDL